MMMLFMTFGLFNVIVALYVENTVAAAKLNDVLLKRVRLADRARLKVKTLELCEAILTCLPNLNPEMKENGINAEISSEAFEEIVKHERVQDIFNELDINIEDRSELFDVLDADGLGATL